MISSIPTLIPWLPLFCPILDHLSQLIYASTSLYHFCTYHNPVTFLFPALSRIPSLLPTPPPLFCLKLLIGLFLHSHHPLFHFISPVCYQLHSRLLLFNFIIVIYIHRGYCFMFCYFYLVFYVVKCLKVIF